MKKRLAYQEQPAVNSLDNDLTPHQTVQQLMAMILEKLSLARCAIESNNLVVKGEALSQVITILGVLQGSLQPQPGNESLAYDLDNLYHYMMTLALKANYHNQIEVVDEIIRLMTTIKSGWDQIANAS